MTTTNVLIKSTLAAVASGVLLTSGCGLPPHPSVFKSSLTPRLYCPGDTLTAEFDIEAGQPCVSRPGFNCADLTPTIDVTSTSTALTPRRITAFSARFDFTPAEDQVQIGFESTSTHLLYPSVDSAGRNIFVSRTLFPRSFLSTRLDGGHSEILFHHGTCVGSTPTYLPQRLSGSSQNSLRVVAESICNSNSIPISLSVSGVPGATGMLAPGECMPLGVRPDEQVVEVNAGATFPGTQCGAVEGQTPPPGLRTHVRMQCGN